MMQDDSLPMLPFIFDLSDNIRNCSKEFAEWKKLFSMHIHISECNAFNKKRYIKFQSGLYDEFEEFSE